MGLQSKFCGGQSILGVKISFMGVKMSLCGGLGILGVRMTFCGGQSILRVKMSVNLLEDAATSPIMTEWPHPSSCPSTFERYRNRPRL